MTLVQHGHLHIVEYTQKFYLELHRLQLQVFLQSRGGAVSGGAGRLRLRRCRREGVGDGTGTGLINARYVGSCLAVRAWLLVVTLQRAPGAW
eukprot:g24959.t1